MLKPTKLIRDNTCILCGKIAYKEIPNDVNIFDIPSSRLMLCEDHYKCFHVGSIFGQFQLNTNIYIKIQMKRIKGREPGRGSGELVDEPAFDTLHAHRFHKVRLRPGCMCMPCVYVWVGIGVWGGGCEPTTPDNSPAL